MTRCVVTRRRRDASLFLRATVLGLLGLVGPLACEAAPPATVTPSPISAAEGTLSGPGAEDPRDGSPGSGPAGVEQPSPSGPQGEVESGGSSEVGSAEGAGSPASAGSAENSASPDSPASADAPGTPEVAKDSDTAPVEVRLWQRGKEDSSRSGSAREAAALANKETAVKELFAAAGVSFPPRQVLFRVFKEESELEVWATDDRRDPLRRIATYKICAASGGAGPKTRTGDSQVPEGFYEIDFFKPRSDYYLALHVNYPNRRDRAQRSTGSAIMIHGRCASIGCLAMSDDRIQELWVIGRSLRSGRVQVHMFPQRAMDTLIEATTKVALKGFWRSLAEGKRRFDADPRLPKKISFDADGNYLFD